MDTDSGLLRQIRPAFGGNLMATIVNPVCRPQMASVRPGVMKARQKDTSRRREIVYHAYEPGEPTAVFACWRPWRKKWAELR